MAAANEDGEFPDENGMEVSSEGCRSQWESLVWWLLQRSKVRRVGGPSDSEPDKTTCIFGPRLLQSSLDPAQLKPPTSQGAVLYFQPDPHFLSFPFCAHR